MATIALYNLSWDENTRLSVIAQGGMRAIGIISTEQEDTETAQCACQVLYNLSCCAENVVALVQEGVIEMVRKLSKLSVDGHVITTHYMSLMLA